jgi:hypothetical protein
MVALTGKVTRLCIHIGSIVSCKKWVVVLWVDIAHRVRSEAHARDMARLAKICCKVPFSFLHLRGTWIDQRQDMVQSRTPAWLVTASIFPTWLVKLRPHL